MIQMRVFGDALVAGQFRLAGVSMKAKAPALVRHHAMLYQTEVKAKASGRPGPRVITGHYRRSITMEMISYNLMPAAIVGTNAPQGRRLEFGFVAVDSLGRHYAQPAFPHFEPPIANRLDEMAEDFARLAVAS